MQTIDVAACFKVQIAYYETWLKGMEAYAKTKVFKGKGRAIIADVKRGDIAKLRRCTLRHILKEILKVTL